MKTTKLLYLKFFILILLSACSSEEVVPIESTQAPEVYEESIPVFSPNGKKAATLKFTSTSLEDLEGIADFEFVAVGVDSYQDVPSEGDENIGFSATHQNVEPSSSDKTPTNSFTSGISVDLIPEKAVEAITIEVKSKFQKNTSSYQSARLIPAGTKEFFFGEKHWRRIQIENLSTYPLDVSFWYYINPCSGGYCTIIPGDPRGPFTGYTGFNYTLYRNGWAYYYNCGKGVGALVTIKNNNPWHFRWTWWSNCKP